MYKPDLALIIYNGYYAIKSNQTKPRALSKNLKQPWNQNS